MYLFLATLGLQCFMQAFFVIEGGGNMQSSRGMVFLVAEHGLQVHRLKWLLVDYFMDLAVAAMSSREWLSSCGAQA